jgi:hypothetical protein
MEIVAAIAIYIAGVVTGLYAASQIEKDINKRIKK